MSRIFLVEVNGCYDCPFKEYDANYNIGYDSGHDCHHGDCGITRIADDGELKKKEKTLHGFPDWCPLKDPKPGIYSIKIPTEEV